MTDVIIVDPEEPNRFSRAESFAELLQADMTRTRKTGECEIVREKQGELLAPGKAPGPAFLPGKEK